MDQNLFMVLVIFCWTQKAKYLGTWCAGLKQTLKPNVSRKVCRQTTLNDFQKWEPQGSSLLHLVEKRRQFFGRKKRKSVSQYVCVCEVVPLLNVNFVQSWSLSPPWPTGAEHVLPVRVRHRMILWEITEWISAFCIWDKMCSSRR